MRISTQQIFQSNVQRMQDISVQQAKTQEQLSTGKRVNRPADDPVAAARMLRLGQELERMEQYQRNIDFAENRLEQEDSTLGSVNDLLLRVRELTVQSGNGSLTREDRTYIAAELRQRLDQLAGLANSQDSNGQFVFGGFDGATAPFEEQGGAWIYVGDEGQRLLEVDSGVKVPISDNGKRIFVDIPAAQTFSAVNGDTALAGAVADKAAFEAAGGTYPVNLEIEFLTPPTTYTVSDLNTTPATQLGTAPATFTFEPGETNEAVGLAFEVGGDLAGGETFTVTAPVKQGVLTSLENLIAGLENYQGTEAGKVEFGHVVSSSLANLDNAQSRILEVRAEVGARLNTVESTRDFLADSALLTEGVLSEIRDLDYAEAISRFTQQNTVLQAAQQSFARITQLSLFDRL
jgi:flagellar hook-associated protein 3 FlgL